MVAVWATTACLCMVEKGQKKDESSGYQVVVVEYKECWEHRPVKTQSVVIGFSTAIVGCSKWNEMKQMKGSAGSVAHLRRDKPKVEESHW